jgi:hypothetical protein
MEKNISLETSKQALEVAAQFAESERIPWNSPRPFATKTTMDFDQVTFNNSITIDAIG